MQLSKDQLSRHVVQLLDMGVHLADGAPVLVMQHAGHDLYDLLSSFPDLTHSTFFLQLMADHGLMAIYELSRAGYAAIDGKPWNMAVRFYKHGTWELLKKLQQDGQLLDVLMEADRQASLLPDPATAYALSSALEAGISTVISALTVEIEKCFDKGDRKGEVACAAELDQLKHVAAAAAKQKQQAAAAINAPGGWASAGAGGQIAASAAQLITGFSMATCTWIDMGAAAAANKGNTYLSFDPRAYTAAFAPFEVGCQLSSAEKASGRLDVVSLGLSLVFLRTGEIACSYKHLATRQASL